MKKFVINEQQEETFVNKLFEIIERKYDVKITRIKKKA